MDNPVSKGGCADQTFFGFVNIEVVIRPGLVGICAQLFSQRKQVAFQVKLKRSDCLAGTLAAPGSPVSPEQIGESVYS